ncbi:hypothetical protein C8Q77DRAFT_1246522 [Trametes polyzona]|nr:hypothetical protein C8Q77DRAFT_1246522 [Trametes polyzona]
MAEQRSISEPPSPQATIPRARSGRADATEDHSSAEAVESDLRQQLPRTLSMWRMSNITIQGDSDQTGTLVDLWKLLRAFFMTCGYTLWKQESGSGSILCPDVDDIEDVARHAHGYAYATQHRGIGPQVGSVNDLFGFVNKNPLYRPARQANGRDVMIRVLAIGERGRTHIAVLEATSMGPYAYFNDNHSVPLLDFVHFQDITFGVFPKVGFRMQEAYGSWAKNSVGDVVDMILQCVEALVFVHSLTIAHRNAFKDSFLVEWHPESLLAGHTPRSRPRVFLTDFEAAVMFSDKTPFEQCLVSGYPIGESYETYTRPVPPEVESGEPYDPFKLDVWQLGKSLEDFKSNVPNIDEILQTLASPHAQDRPSSSRALRKLSSAAAGTTPEAMMTAPDVMSPSSSF